MIMLSSYDDGNETGNNCDNYDDDDKWCYRRGPPHMRPDNR